VVREIRLITVIIHVVPRINYCFSEIQAEHVYTGKYNNQVRYDVIDQTAVGYIATTNLLRMVNNNYFTITNSVSDINKLMYIFKFQNNYKHLNYL